MPKPFDPQLKQEIITAVKNGMTQAEACRMYGISSATMSTWCRRDVVGGEKNYIVQVNQLKRELDNAYRVIGKLSARADRPKG
ncbi:MAG: helix-turn-helix domain-containing protein [Candidatus Saccharimonadales bacterium]|jgi:transposase-like protein